MTRRGANFFSTQLLTMLPGLQHQILGKPWFMTQQLLFGGHGSFGRYYNYRPMSTFLV